MEQIILGKELHKADNHIRRRIDAIAIAHGVTGIQAFVLHYICMHAPNKDVFQRDVEHEFDVRRSTVSSVITHLESKGLLTRAQASRDGRLKKLVPTERGLATEQAIYAQMRSFNRSLCGLLSGEEIIAFVSMLRRLQQNTPD